jgi:hypothetical protein
LANERLAANFIAWQARVFGISSEGAGAIRSLNCRRILVSSRNSAPSLNRRSRPTTELNPSLNRRLQSYVSAAMGAVTNLNKSAFAVSAISVAGVALVASLPTEAEVVYTPANIKITPIRSGVTTVQLDINNDGQPDFQFAALSRASFSSGRDDFYGTLNVGGDLPSNQAMISHQGGLVAALPRGAKIGPDGKFGPGHYMAICDDFSGSGFTSGNWVHINNRYLGVKFQIDGEIHYGWVRMGTDCNSGTITGYAYETVANQRLRAGQGAADDQIDSGPAALQQLTPKPATLGALAAGAAGLGEWRPQ